MATPAPVKPAGNQENVEFVRPELTKYLWRYRVVRDVIAMEIKSDSGYVAEDYLPDPTGTPKADQDDYEKLRHLNYCKRAIFYDYTSKALGSFVGQIFSRDPQIEVPETLAWVVKDATGDGLSLEQLAKKAVSEVLSIGRIGIFIDYPNNANAPTRQQLVNGDIRPTLLPFLSENIINWRTKSRNNKQIVSLVVLRESYVTADDGFEAQYETQYRVLDLEERNGVDVYRVRIWRLEGGFVETYHPVVGGVNPNEIPFAFIGSENNDPTPDKPPMYGMANINIGHFRNSADYEESVTLNGQPTLAITNLKQTWLDKVLKGIVRIGSRNGLSLPEGSTAKLLQADPNTLAKSAMEDKEKQMAALGADFLKEQSVVRTATEAEIDDISKTSAIGNAAKNVSAAFQFALEWAALYQGEKEESVTFLLNSEFDLTSISAAERAANIKDKDAGLLTWSECRSALKKAGIATLDDEEAKKEIEDDYAAELERTSKELAVTTSFVQQGNNE